MRRDEPPYFMANGTMFPARLVNVLFDVVTLREIFSAAISLPIYTRGSNNAFRPHEFAEGSGMDELELTLSENKEPEEILIHMHYLPVRVGNL